MEKKVVVALDAMGGDNAPVEIVKGATEAVKEMPVEILLVGQPDILEKELKQYTFSKERIRIVPATEVISTEEVPTTAIRRKKDSSMVVGLTLLKNKEADAFVSAGSTGALLTGALVLVGRLPGVERPVLGTALPTKKGFTFLVDSGANVDCKAKYLEQFAAMGSVYVENMFGVKNPKVGLLNIGAEKEKGNALTKEAYSLLEESNINFAGNIEPRDIPFGAVDVVVCDGFVGNVILKLSEGLSSALLGIIKEAITEGFYKFAALCLKKPFAGIKKRFDADEVGGAPFLGVQALVVKAHGSSKARAIKGAIQQCVLFTEADIVTKIGDIVKYE